MRRLLRFFLYRPIQWVVDHFSSAPDRERVFKSLSKLVAHIDTSAGKKGFTIPVNWVNDKFIIFSDQHKGRRNGADDFMLAEEIYVAALGYYNQEGYHFISLGDSEELWENTLLQVRKHNEKNFEAEKAFVRRSAFTKIFGNHDLDWDIDPLAPVYLKEIYGQSVSALESVMLEGKLEESNLRIFCTHGHQGDRQSDGNRFSRFMVAKVWAPLQAYLKITPHTPSYDKDLKTLHNQLMYEWAQSQNNLILITGHTHQPVFESLTFAERERRRQHESLESINPEWAEAIESELSWQPVSTIGTNLLGAKPCYFNSGCCCFPAGEITGIEVANGCIRLVRWAPEKNAPPVRKVLQEKKLSEILKELNQS